ncbi:MAG TPA: hypothetical protein VNQ76_00010 [Planctomicrobium sp.]|nr:hypothetical protein [Planctomicrobium sp.]
MGQLNIASIQAGRQSEVVMALGQAGFEITRTPPEHGEKERYRCRRDDREIVLTVWPGRPDLDETFIVLPHPPYTVRPWRWGGDGRFFGEVTAVLDEFHYRD